MSSETTLKRIPTEVITAALDSAIRRYWEEEEKIAFTPWSVTDFDPRGDFGIFLVISWRRGDESGLKRNLIFFSESPPVGASISEIQISGLLYREGVKSQSGNPRFLFDRWVQLSQDEDAIEQLNTHIYTAFKDVMAVSAE